MFLKSRLKFFSLFNSNRDGGLKVTKVSGSYQDITGIWSALFLPPETMWLQQVMTLQILQPATLQF